MRKLIFMNILIIGMGFAGNIYHKALSHLKTKEKYNINIAYHSKRKNRLDTKYYSTIESALKNHSPSLIIVTVNDIYHFNILNKLKDYDGTILCEKPLVGNQEELDKFKKFFSYKTTLILSTVIRFSLASQKLKHFLRSKNYSIKKINFTWKKNRINDFRPTVGVISEIIHPLDTIQWLFDTKIDIQHILTTSSNYSVSRDMTILDSAFILGTIKDSIISGYSSFVSLQVERSIEIVLKDSDLNKHYYIILTFDKDEWFSDKLTIFQETKNGYSEILNFNSMNTQTNYDKKLERTLLMLKNIFNKDKDNSDLCLNQDAIDTQSLLNLISKNSLNKEIDYEFSSKDILQKESTNFDRIG